MKRSKFFLCLGTAAITLSTFVFIVSCNKKKDTTTTNTTEDTGYATDHVMAEQSFDDVQTIADKASGVTSGGSLNFKVSSCATVTNTGSVITIDFGATNCLCSDGRYRRGKIIVNYTGAYADSASTHTITFSNYFQNNNQITGTKTVTNMGHNSLGQPYFNVTVTGEIVRASGVTISANWNRVRTWTAGYNTLGDRTDDVYAITGSGTLTRAAGVVTVTIPSTTPLVIAASCNWIEAGTVNYTLPSGLTRSLNYGDTPGCDDLAILTLANGNLVNITLP